MLLSDWLTVIVVGWFVIIVPGPNMLIVFRNSLIHSRQAGIWTALGLAIGNLVHITYCLIGIGVLISQSIMLFNMVKLAGAGYLIYLGIKSLKAQPRTIDVDRDAPPDLSAFAALRTGFLTDLLNPKATLFFLALFTQLIRPETTISARIGYGLTIVALEFVILAGLACVIGQASIRRQFNLASHWVERATGVVLIGLGLRVAFSRGFR
ncbi:MAG: LysE family translocator [Candidatus Omnitrophica bacterium]|nr:LysE family translocator [Candidatus Omnitrophota bacterium]